MKKRGNLRAAGNWLYLQHEFPEKPDHFPGAAAGHLALVGTGALCRIRRPSPANSGARSCVERRATLRVTAGEIEIEGIGGYTWTAGYPKLRLVVARFAEDAPSGPATARFLAVEDALGGTNTPAQSGIGVRRERN